MIEEQIQGDDFEFEVTVNLKYPGLDYRRSTVHLFNKAMQKIDIMFRFHYQKKPISFAQKLSRAYLPLEERDFRLGK